MTEYRKTASAAMTDDARPELIALKSLIYAIGCIQSLPEDRQERSDMVAMCALARRSGSRLPWILWGVEHHIGRKIDLWPAHGGDEADRTYSDKDLDRRDELRRVIDQWAAEFQRTQAEKDAPPSNVVKFIGNEDQDGEAA